MKITLRLLGPPEIRTHEMLSFGPTSAKGRALLFYLVSTKSSHTRSQLAGLLWGTHPDESARANLRKILAEVDKQMGDWFAVNGQTVNMRAVPFG